MTADLIPVFKVKGNTMELFNKVISTLVEKNPPGWNDRIEKMFERDIIQPQAFGSQKKDNTESFVGLKLLNYGEDQSFLIQPAQDMAVEDFQTNVILREAYVHLKDSDRPNQRFTKPNWTFEMTILIFELKFYGEM